MDRKQFLEQLAAPAGGKENIGLCDFRSGCLSVTVKDRSVIDLNAIRGLPGVADAELLRSRLRITPDQTIMEELQMAKKEDYGALAKQILSLVGGAENVSNATHCATRLRFNLKDESKADTDAIKGLAGVVGVAQANGQYQVIIGAEVTQVYEKLSGMLGTAPAAAAPAPKGTCHRHPDRHLYPYPAPADRSRHDQGRAGHPGGVQAGQQYVQHLPGHQLHGRCHVLFPAYPAG